MSEVDYQELYVGLAAALYAASGALDMPLVWMDFLLQAAEGGTEKLKDDMFPLMPDRADV